MKTATYTLTNGENIEVSYDPSAACTICNLPVQEASVGGTAVCPWCDCGIYRDGTKWLSSEIHKIRKEAKIRDGKEI